MTETEINIALANLSGEQLPFTGSLDAIVPVVRGMPSDIRGLVMEWLCGVVDKNEWAALATPMQWCEAVLRAKGLWK